MRKFSTAVIAAAAFVMIAAAPGATAEEPFAIALPEGFGEFVAQTASTESENGTIETTNWISKSPSGEAVVVTVSQMPGTILDADAMLDSTRDSLIKSLNATLESEQDIEGEMPGTRLTFRSGDAAFLQSQLFIDDDRLYQVLYVGRSEEQRATPAVRSLFESFRMNEAPAEEAAPASTTARS